MKVKLGISNRHIHLAEEDYKILFGDEEINKVKDLIQPGEFVSDKKLSIKTEKAMINNVRLLAPFRSYSQVEISKTDSFQLGINPPVRDSGNLIDASEITIVGPCGEITKKCAIIATRHLHITPDDIIKYGLSGKEKVMAKINSEKTTIFDDVYIKASPNYELELHLDTDDGNSALAQTGEDIEIIF